ncbi:MAG: nuclear transport factor 2 family protein [Roseibium sp.]|uniref:YybH family protein n=1 Tax=Roseibium sp. TaxID=1936156 RepID=UPI0026113FAC|nr:nuclear transport factor 2 family protein [Roseibium sp.]MCV0429456.1 nuclear transport factor 2 family protein [Roseibium sp.]
MTTEIEAAALEKLSNWKSAFNTGNAAGCAACYEEDALMVATPFGEFKGRAAIQAFWADLIEKGFADVAYKDAKVDVLNDKEAIISASWSMNNTHGIITKEHWVLQDDGTALLREDRFEVQG